MNNWQQCWYRTSFDPCALSPDFLKRLYKFDSGRIRLRWSYDRRKWAVERKSMHSVEYVHKVPEYIPRVLKPEGIKVIVPNETYIIARDGYLVIDYLDPQPIPHDWVIFNLQANDIRRLGGAKEYIRKLERVEELRKDKKNKDHSEQIRHVASEMYDHLKRRYGEQSFVPRDFKFGQTNVNALQRKESANGSLHQSKG